MNGLTISQAAKEAGVHIETIRYYERRGLLPSPPRTNSGYRMLSVETVHDIRFIKRAQDLGFTLEEIKMLLSIYKAEDYFPIAEMHHFATEKISQIEEKIEQLNRFKSILELVAHRPFSGRTPSKNDCPIIQNLSNGGKE
ncbi:MerR family transcriptional regulator [Brevibacillus panacihumi]|uniref:MerR family transcriptional regulator n=1 Tax=Brevibacillus panacihumi TaxID=497735 RepID=UPI003D1C3A9C